MRKVKMWRVRCKRSVEEWIGVQAESALQAEQIVSTMPNVLSILSGSTISGDRPVGQTIQQGIQDDDE